MDDHALTLPGLPFPLRWQLAPQRWHLGEDGSLSIQAGPGTDLFVDPQGAASMLNAPRLLGSPSGDFQLSARVTVDFAATFDAGVLLLYTNERSWAKLCFERAPSGEAMVVSVVTRDVSDDANSFAVEAPQVWLRMSRLGPAWAFHASTDGSRWQFIRHFALDSADGLASGFLAQSPTGSGCTAVFDAITYRPEGLADLRGGA
jgi:uncharacterized protein